MPTKLPAPPRTKRHSFNLTQYYQVPPRLKLPVHFSADQDSSIGDLVTQSLIKWVSQWRFDLQQFGPLEDLVCEIINPSVEE